MKKVGVEPAWASSLRGIVLLLLWTAFSSGLIVINKQIYSKLGFAKPSFLTGIGQFGSFLGGLALIRLGILPCRQIRDKRTFVIKLTPIVLSTAATMWFGVRPVAPPAALLLALTSVIAERRLPFSLCLLHPNPKKLHPWRHLAFLPGCWN